MVSVINLDCNEFYAICWVLALQTINMVLLAVSPAHQGQKIVNFLSSDRLQCAC